MKWIIRGTVLTLAVMLAAACDDSYEKGNLKAAVDANTATADALSDWAELLTVDNDPSTTPGGPQDPAYLLVQTRAICAAAEYVEMKHPGSTPDGRPQFLKDLCGPPQPDPLYPPPFPPSGTN